VAALSAAAQAGPSHFQYVKTIEIGGRRSTTETIDGVIDLAASRGRSRVQHLPGTAVESTSEVELDGSHLFVRRANPRASGVLWELAYGGPADFLGLDLSGPDAIATLETMFSSPGRWRVVASDPSDAQGSRRIQLHPPMSNGTAISLVLDRDGRLTTVEAVSLGSGSSAGSETRVLTFVEFGVPLNFEPPG
jgi:hypothetical protein